MPAVGGFVFDQAGVPINRELRIYRRDTGALLGKTRSSGGEGDQHFDKVSLLLHMTGDDGSTAFPDTSPTSNAVTAYGHAKISTAHSPFGGSSGYFDGVGDYLQVTSGAVELSASSQWTVEAFFRVQSFPAAKAGIFFNGDTESNNHRIQLEINGTGTISTYLQADVGTGITVTSAHSVAAGEWAHAALVKDASNIRMYLRGELTATSTFSHAITPNNNFYAGLTRSGGSLHFLHGYLSEMRVTRGVARYSSNFTPPAAPFPEISNPGRPLTFGEYYFTTDYTGEVQVVCLDDASAPLENDLILRTFPV